MLIAQHSDLIINNTAYASNFTEGCFYSQQIEIFGAHALNWSTLSMDADFGGAVESFIKMTFLARLTATKCCSIWECAYGNRPLTKKPRKSYMMDIKIVLISQNDNNRSHLEYIQFAGKKIDYTFLNCTAKLMSKMLHVKSKNAHKSDNSFDLVIFQKKKNVLLCLKNPLPWPLVCNPVLLNIIWFWWRKCLFTLYKRSFGHYKIMILFQSMIDKVSHQNWSIFTISNW